MGTDSNAIVTPEYPTGIVPLSKPVTFSWSAEKAVGFHPISTPGFGDITIVHPDSDFSMTIATNVSVYGDDNEFEYHSPPLASFGVPPGDAYEFEYLPTNASPLQWDFNPSASANFNVTAE